MEARTILTERSITRPLFDQLLFRTGESSQPVRFSALLGAQRHTVLVMYGVTRMAAILAYWQSRGRPETVLSAAAAMLAGLSTIVAWTQPPRGASP